MKKHFFLTLVLLFTFFSSIISQPHSIFEYWDMDQWNGSYGGAIKIGDWHDMDFNCSFTRGYFWKLVIGNSSGVEFESGELDLTRFTQIMPTWEKASGLEADFTPNENQIMMPHGFMPTYFKIYFYDANGDKDEGLTIGDDDDPVQPQVIDLNNQYLYDKYYYYNSLIQTFSSFVDMQTGNINLSAKILQPERFFLTVNVSNQAHPNIIETYSGIENKSFTFSRDNGWEREKVVDYLNKNLSIDYNWLGINNLIGNNIKIELILDSEMWGWTEIEGEPTIYWYTQFSDNHITYINNRPTTPTISMSGGFGDNPTLTFSGGGANVDHYILKKEYDFNDGTGFHDSYIEPASSPWIDVNVERTRFGGDIVVRYSVCAVDAYDNESDYSNTVSTNGQSLWKNIEEGNVNEEAINEYALNSNYPNPFNPTTQITYQIPKNSFVNLNVYNSLGQKVAHLINQNQSSGKYSIQFNANNLPSGIYIYKLQAGEFRSVKKMLLIR